MKPVALATAAVLLAACNPAPTATPEPTDPASLAPREAPEAPPAPPSCEREANAGAARPTPIDAAGAGSSVALARFEDRTLAFVADEDEAALRTIDIDARAEVARTPLGGKPAQLLVLPDGRVVVALRDRAAIDVLDPPSPAAPLERLCRVDAPAEPVALATTPDGATLLVASRWGHALSAYAARDLARLGAVDLPRDPAAIVASADGRTAFVAHAVGSRVSVVDLAGGGLIAGGAAPEGERPAAAAARALSLDAVEWRRVSFMELDMPPRPLSLKGRRRERPVRATRVDRVGNQGFSLARATSGVVFAPQALVDTGPSATGGGYGGSSVGTVVGGVAVIDPAGERAVVPPISGSLGIKDCFLPRAAAFDPRDNLLLVACLGVDAVIAYDAAAQGAAGAEVGKTPRSPHARELFRYALPAGPTGIAVDAAEGRAVVFSQHAGALSVLPLGREPAVRRSAADVGTIQLDRARPVPDNVALGRRLFHAAGHRRIAFDGRACATCHPGGRDDGLTWSTPEGPRQTPALAGRLQGTAPYGWEGDKVDLPSHFARTIERLSGAGLSPGERDALFAYIATLSPPADAAPARPDLERARARGDALFHDERVGCSSCHLGDDVTTDGAKHDVKSAALLDPPAFETPSLRSVSRTAPYFHDGRYATLLDVVRGADGTMGHTGHLSDDDRAALVAYMEAL